MNEALRLALLAFSLGLDTLSVSVGIGLQGVSRQQALRIAASFTLYQVLLPIPGLLLGERLGRAWGDVAAYLGFGALIALGLYVLWEALRQRRRPISLAQGFGLVLASLAVSLDSFAVGFSLGLLGVHLVPALIAIGISGLAMTLVGLAFGDRLGRTAQRLAEVAAGVVLSGTGVALLVQKLWFS